MCRHMYPCRYFSPIRFFVPKVIIKMATHESCEDPVKSPAADKADTTVQSKTDKEAEKESSIVSSVNQQKESNNIIDTEEKKSLTLGTNNKCTDTQKKDADNVESENKRDPNSQITVKKQLDDNEADEKREAQNVDKKQEMSNADSQKMNEEKDIKIEDDKDSVAKVGSALKRKRKALRLV